MSESRLQQSVLVDPNASNNNLDPFYGNEFTYSELSVDLIQNSDGVFKMVGSAAETIGSVASHWGGSKWNALVNQKALGIGVRFGWNTPEQYQTYADCLR